MKPSFFLTALLALGAGHATAADSADDAIFKTVSELDSQFFGTFNTCSDPAQLKKHAELLDPNVEFYHDNGGVTWTRKDYLDRTGANVCGHFRRKLTPGTLKAYPVKDFGAIEEGEQMFCDIKTDRCFGAAKFMLVWHKTSSGWQVTRAFSYGHRAL